MLQNIDLNQVKQYNNSLKQYRDKAANLKAQIEYTNKELDSLCEGLTAELGVQVTRDNVEQIYNEQLAKINSTLQSGTAVLSKIAGEEQSLVGAQQTAPQAPVQTPVTPQAPVSAQPPVMNTAPQAAPAPNPFAGQENSGVVPPMFSLG